MSVNLKQLIPIDDPTQFKLHLACFNNIEHPLDVFVRSRAEWQNWNSYRGKVNRFNRPYILSFIQMRPDTNIWLFGGIYQVLSDKNPKRYDVKLLDTAADLIGRLKAHIVRSATRGDTFRLEGLIDTIEVVEILRTPYDGEAFCGYEKINHDFRQLETIFKQEKTDWKSSLSSVKGVYVIFDKSNGKKYVGSAYGTVGIWARWSAYMKTGHGSNDEFSKIINEKGMDYARENFRFALLEYRPMKTDDSEIILRESYWKEVLLSRGLYGYNKN